MSGIRLRLLSFAGLLALWAAAGWLAQSRLLPGPVEVLGGLYGYAVADDLIPQVAVTLSRVAASFVIAMIVGSAIGMAMGRDRRTDAFLDGLLVIALNLPALVVIMLCYVWFGLGEMAAILAVVINKVPLVVVNMREGARSVDRELLQVAEAFRLPPRRTFFKVYLPQLYPYLMASARAGLALIWKIVLVVELLGRSDGIGFKLGVFFQFFDVRGLLAYSFGFIAVILAIEYLVLGPVERRLAGWRK